MKRKGKKLLRRLSIFVLAAFSVISFSLTAVVTDKVPVTTVNAEDNEAYRAALKQYNQGSLGYFQQKANAGNAYAARAVRVLQTASARVVNGTRHNGVASGLTHIGSDNDATSLENMKTALELLRHGNQLRTSDSNVRGLPEWKVRDDWMAYAQASANMESQFQSHWRPMTDVYGEVTGNFYTAENICGGTSNTPGNNDHYSGWYTEEKRAYESKNGGNTSHYKILISSQYVTTGIGVNERDPIFNTTGVQEFSSDGNGSVSWQAYYNDFMKYYNRITNNLKKAEAGLKEPSFDPSVPSNAQGRVKMYRAYNPNSGEHFYTKDQKEFNHIVSLGWRNEGIGWIAPEKSDIPVYRLYNKNGGEHHYTVSLKERYSLMNAGWTDEGIGWYSENAAGVPLYREYNPNAFANNHNYTTDEHENDVLLSLGWRFEGVGWYGLYEN